MKIIPVRLFTVILIIRGFVFPLAKQEKSNSVIFSKVHTVWHSPLGHRGQLAPGPDYRSRRFRMDCYQVTSLSVYESRTWHLQSRVSTPGWVRRQRTAIGHYKSFAKFFGT